MADLEIFLEAVGLEEAGELEGAEVIGRFRIFWRLSSAAPMPLQSRSS
jgi:hypothetical protein